MANFMTQSGYTDIHLLFVYKPQQNTAGMHWLMVVEQMIGARTGFDVKIT